MKTTIRLLLVVKVQSSNEQEKCDQSGSLSSAARAAVTGPSPEYGTGSSPKLFVPRARHTATPIHRLCNRRFSWEISKMAALSINGQTHQVDVDPNTPLLWVLRDTIGLTGTKYGCGIAQCGACTVHVDGIAMRSCSVPLSAGAGRQTTTTGGPGKTGALQKRQKAWPDHAVPQCGYCQCGMIMAVAALLKDKPKPSDADIDANITNICRCGTFQQVRAAIHAAA